MRVNNRRKRPDLLLQLLAWFNAAAVFALAAALCFIAVAKPQMETFFDRYYNLTLRKTWDESLVGYIALTLALSFVTSMIGLILNSRRLKRKGDHIHSTLVISLVVSIVGLVAYFRSF